MSGLPILRVYDPAECDAAGVPLDWERCRHCGGPGSWRVAPTEDYETCHVCEGHGSLKAAALAVLRGRTSGLVVGDVPPVRCEGCAHPMSEGTWDWRQRPANPVVEIGQAWEMLSTGREPVSGQVLSVHYSPCDEGCRHGGPGRGRVLAPGGAYLAEVTNAAGEAARHGFEASWRSVDVRTLGWAHDLRPEKLAVLCLRCYAERRP